MGESVFVSGANGYIAQHIVKELIAQGYKVVGSVRTPEKGERLRKLLNSPNFDYEIVEDLAKEGVFDKPLKNHPDVVSFIHAASPVMIGSDDVEKNIINPAITGTTSALKAIKAYAPQIKKVVLTSSYAAINSFSHPSVTDGGVVTENSWTTITREYALKNPETAYTASKTLAERAAWDFVENEKPNFKLTVINPVFVFGPQAFKECAVGKLNFSADMVTSLLSLKSNDPIPKMKGSFIDVRDVAKGHICALQNSNSDGKRLMLQNGPFSCQLLVEIIRKSFPQFNDRLPKDNSVPKETKPTYVNDNSFTKKLLNFEFIDLQTSVNDTVSQYLSANNVY